jgi:ABC-type uncharacterized transport system ATPase subunit
MSDVTVCVVQPVGLSKTFMSIDGEIPAVRGIDLAIPDGEFFGLLGPKGAGKSTTIGMLTTRSRSNVKSGWCPRTTPWPASDRRREPRVPEPVLRHQLQESA